MRRPNRDCLSVSITNRDGSQITDRHLWRTTVCRRGATRLSLQCASLRRRTVEAVVPPLAEIQSPRNLHQRPTATYTYGSRRPSRETPIAMPSWDIPQAWTLEDSAVERLCALHVGQR